MSDDHSLSFLLAKVEAARDEAFALLKSGKLEEVKSKFLSRKGVFRQLQQSLGKLEVDVKKVFGKAFNDAHRAVEAAHAEAEQGTGGSKKKGPAFDFLPGVPPKIGGRHPLTQTIEDIVEIFGRMGFESSQGPEVEDVFHNFVALNIPEDHPARDPRDNFYIQDDLLLRSQTSTIQIRVMEEHRRENKPLPIRIIAIGRVYRPDDFDATHSPMFHQVEGLYVSEDASLADLKTVVRMFTRMYLGPEVRIRFRPSFFPFTEPSIEVDMSWGENNDRWIELGGAGMVDPNVFEAVGFDPEKVTGFAFGLGVERLAMRRHKIGHMRNLFENDVRFLRQFS